MQLDQKYHQGLAVIAFPCNQFGNQEPFSNEEIRKFAFEKYHATFPIFDKIDVNGPNASPVYSYLKRASHTGDIEWNYVKFLVSPQGKVLRFAPWTDPLQLEPHIRVEMASAADNKPQRVLRKPVFVKFKDLAPGTHGHNLYGKVVSVAVALERHRPDGSEVKVHEALVGDSTASILLTVRGDQLEVVKPGANIIIRNAKIEMFKNHMRLVVDKWGLIEPNNEPFNEQVNAANNLSDTEYELVSVED